MSNKKDLLKCFCVIEFAFSTSLNLNLSAIYERNERVFHEPTLIRIRRFAEMQRPDTGTKPDLLHPPIVDTHTQTHTAYKMMLYNILVAHTPVTAWKS